MPVISVSRPFSYSDNGYTLVEYSPDRSPIEVSEECARVAREEGWAVKAEPGAPENKDAAKKTRERKTAQT
jgi:hypothetical protein